MKKLLKYLTILTFMICFSVYFTYRIDSYTSISRTQFVCIFLYFLLASFIIIYLIRKKFGTFNKKFERKYIVPFVIITVMITIGNLLLFKGTFFETALNQKVKITALGEKNILSNSSEVWITGIEADGIELDLKNLVLPEGWERRENAILSYKDQPKSIEINIRAQNINIKFLTHAWSGKVGVLSGSNNSSIDLYSKDPSQYKYQLQSQKINPFALTNLHLIISLIILFLGLNYYIFKSFINKSFNPSIVTFIFENYLIIRYYLNIDVWSIICILAFEFVMLQKAVPLLWQYFYNKEIKNKMKLVGVSIVFSTLLSIMTWNFETYSFNNLQQTMKSVFLFGLSVLVIFPIILLIISHLEIKINKNSSINYSLQSVRGFKGRVLYFVLPFVIWLIYFIAAFPGIMTPDSLDQWAQAHNVYQISDVHPAFHTLCIKILIHIWDNPAILTLAQIFTFSIAVFLFASLFEEIGWSKKKIYAFIILFSIFPSNGILAVTLWKDIAYSISFLVFTYLLCKIVVQRESFFAKKTNLLFLFIIAVFVWLFRHNGPLPVIVTFLGLIIAYKKICKAKLITIFICVIVTVNCITGPLYKEFNVQPLQKGYGYQTFVHGLAAIIKNDKNLDLEDMEMMEKIMPKEAWKQLYYPYDVNRYLFNDKNYPYLKVITENADKIPKIYVKYLFRYPGILIKDILTSTNIVWSIYQPTDGYNYKYQTVVLADIEGLHSAKNLGLHSTSSFLTKCVFGIGKISFSTSIFDAILWRFGICLFSILVLMYVIIKKKNFYQLIVFLPFLGHTVSLLTMLEQDYKYVYPAYLSAWFIILFILISNREDSQA